MVKFKDGKPINRYNLIEYLAANESKSFDKLEPIWVEWAENFINGISADLIKYPYHYGDCTKDACPCTLCVIEGLLTEYREYVFGEDGEN